jgi:aldose 1-epimerase
VVRKKGRAKNVTDFKIILCDGGLMSSYTSEIISEDGIETVELKDIIHGVRARFVPVVGVQLLDFSIKRGADELPLIYRPQTLAQLQSDPMLYGNPILFPFPNRIENGRFSFAGFEVNLPINDHKANCAIHGLVFDKPWHLEDFGSDEHSAWVTCFICSEEMAEINRLYPFPFKAGITYRLKDGRLEIQFRAENTGRQVMPMGFGLHPWFNAPLSPISKRGECILKAPFSRVWELENLCPTGKIAKPDEARDLTAGAKLEDMFFDDVYTKSEAEGRWEAIYTDPLSGLEVTVSADPSFRELVIYAPYEPDVLCIEPYTCTTNAFNLQRRGIDAGTILLKPNEVWASMVYFTPRIV